MDSWRTSVLSILGCYLFRGRNAWIIHRQSASIVGRFFCPFIVSIIRASTASPFTCIYTPLPLPVYWSLWRGELFLLLLVCSYTAPALNITCDTLLDGLTFLYMCEANNNISSVSCFIDSDTPTECAFTVDTFFPSPTPIAH